jgi:hypothetical protein
MKEMMKEVTNETKKGKGGKKVRSRNSPRTGDHGYYANFRMTKVKFIS